MTSAELESKLQAVKYKALKNLVSFRYLLLQGDGSDVLPAEFHYEWSDLLLNGKKHTAIQGFRESAKTNYAIRSFLLYSIVFPSKDRDYIILIKANDTLACNKLKEAEREYLSNPVLRANLKKINEQSSKCFDIDVLGPLGDEINVRIEAYGKGASIRGLANIDRRPRVCLIDDPQDIEDSESETIQESDWNWFLSDVMFLGQSTRIFLIGNNLGEKSIAERVFQNADMLNFETHKVPAIVNGVSAWPSKFKLLDIETERENYRKLGKLNVWYREKMCEALADETRTFQREDFVYYPPQNAIEIAKRCNVYIACDLAISEKKSADYTALIVVGVDKDGYWYVLDLVYGHLNPTETIDQIFNLVSRWRPMKVGIEKIAYQKALIHFIEKEKIKRNIMFSTMELVAEKEKELRIKALQPRFKSKMILFPEYSSWLGELETELLMFPKCLHDDLPDAFAYIPSMVTTPIGMRMSLGDTIIPNYLTRRK